MSRNGPRVSPTIWGLYVTYTLVMYLIATDFSPFTTPPKPPAQQPQQQQPQRLLSHPYEAAIPCDLSAGRTAVAYLPELVDKSPDNPLDILIVFHSKARSGWFAQKHTSWAMVAESHKIAVMWGTASGTSHNLGGPNSRWKSESSDFEYFQAILRRAIVSWGRDKTRIFVTGIANGGFFASDLVQRFPNLVAGAYLSMAGMGRVTKPAKVDTPPPVFLVVGDQDPMLKKAELANEAYTAAGYPTSLVKVPGVGHDYQSSKELEALEWLQETTKLPAKSKAELLGEIAAMDLRDWWGPCDTDMGKGWQCSAGGACQVGGETCQAFVAKLLSSGEKVRCVCPPE